MPEHLTVESGYRLRYTVPHEAYYRSVVREETVGITKEAADGGCDWEFDVVSHSRIGVQVRVFDDAFRAFSEIAPLFAALAAERPTSLTALRTMLEEFGITDATQREDPRAPAVRMCACGCSREACELPR